jgi:uncharacterized protein (DUF1684 family)
METISVFVWYRMMKHALLALLLATSTFTADQQQWRETRRTRLTSDGSWLTLVGLEWLHAGSNQITLPAHPPVKRTFVLKDGQVTMDGAVLRDDTDPQGPTVTTIGSLSFTVIKRSDKNGSRYGIRMKDTQSAARKKFKGLTYFPADESYRVEAKFEPYNPPKKIAITNVLGMTSDEIAPGALVFNLKGKTYRIDPILEQGETDLFIIFKDATSGKETYGAARYLYASPPDKDGKTVIDFNRAYNPPCAFTPYATCPLPPPQNRLKVRIEAGEKKYAGGHS